MLWNTREHWFWGLVLPGRLAILCTAVGTLLIPTPWFWTVFTGICLMVVGLVALFEIFFHWQAFSIAFPAGEGVLLERNGRRLIVERRIGLTMVGNITYEQTLPGRLFDYGTLTIGALGGPYRWENLGRFRTIRRIINSQGSWIPPAGNPLLLALHRQFRSSVRMLRGLQVSLFGFLHGLGQEMGTIGRHLGTPSYRRFIEFAETVLFLGGEYFLVNSSSNAHFTEEEIRLYRRILQVRRLLVLDRRGRIQRHKRIRTLRDIRRYVPPSWFHKVTRAA